MAPRNPFRPFTPNPEMTALLPDITGNEINGLNEQEVRRPKVVYWAPDPDEIAFGEVQKWFYTRERVGVTALQDEWLYEIVETSFANVIVLGVQHDYDKLKSAPDQVAGADFTRQYGRAAAAAKKVAGWRSRAGGG